jgi:aminomethyltransferase
MVKVTPLHACHLELGAKMADFGGWDMPIEYSGTVAEHLMVRESVGVFDVSHMGKIRIQGPHACDVVNMVLTNDLNRIGTGDAQYSMLCNDAGGVIDDLIVYRLTDDDILIVPNAANAESVFGELNSRIGEDAQVCNRHEEWGIVAIQGPSSAKVLAQLDLPNGHDFMTVVEAEFAGHPVFVCRSGYTGERGFEVVAPRDALIELWQAAITSARSEGGGPIGLGARDTLRTEMGYPLHGQDISPSISPVEAGLSWAVGWDKPSFLGKTALVQEKSSGPRRRLRGLRAQGRAIPRAHMGVVNVAGESVGEITSGTFSPSDKVGIALALLDGSVNVGDEVLVDIRGRSMAFSVVTPPFVTSRVR